MAAKAAEGSLWSGHRDLRGLWVTGPSNEVYSNKVGIQVADAAIEVRDNIIHNNSDYGIYGSGYGVVITGNVSYDNGIAVNGDGGEGHRTPLLGMAFM